MSVCVCLVSLSGCLFACVVVCMCVWCGLCDCVCARCACVFVCYCMCGRENMCAWLSCTFDDERRAETIIEVAQAPSLT